MSAWRGALLVARREIVERGRDRTFQVGTLASLVLVLGIVALANVLGGGDERYTIAVVQGDTAGEQLARAAAPAVAAGGAELDVRTVPDRAAADRLVDDRDADAALVDDGAVVVVHQSLPGVLEQALRSGASSLAVERRLAAAGVGEAERRAALTPAPLEIAPRQEPDGGAAGAAFFAALLLYGQLITFSLWVANGIAEEKASRVVELLLSAVPSTALLAGKIVGIGVLGFVQLLLLAAVGLGAAGATGAVDVDAAVLQGAGAAVAFFVLGYLVFAALFAVAGALVSRQEDVQSTTSPLILVLVVAFFVALQALQNPTSPIADVAALVPFSSPVVMPALLITGEATAGQAALAIAILLVTVAALLVLAARVYDRAVLRTGARVPLLEALAGRS